MSDEHSTGRLREGGTAVADQHLSVQGVSRAFGGLQAVSRVSLDVARGSVTAVIGPNGAGKSTLLHLISGFIPVDEGTVRINGRDVTKLPPWRRAAYGMARTFQDLEVFERLTVLENVALAVPAPVGGSPLRLLLRPRGYRDERRAVRAEALRHLETVGLADRADDKAHDLSYGDQKLLIIARLLATGRDLLLLDEPGAGLSVSAIDELGLLLRRLAADGRTVVVVDHNMRLILDYSDYVYVLHHGTLIAHGTPAKIRADAQVISVYLGGDIAEVRA